MYSYRFYLNSLACDNIIMFQTLVILDRNSIYILISLRRYRRAGKKLDGVV